MAEKPAKGSWKIFRRFNEEFGFVIGNAQTLIIRFMLSLWAAHLS